MNSDEIATLCKQLSLDENVVPVARLDSELQGIGLRKMELSLVGRLFTNKLVNREAFRSIIPKIWRIKDEVDVEVIGSNTFSFNFPNSADRQRVLSAGGGARGVGSIEL
ncbi:hypothetical protein ACOSQ3_032456 [Xanthoceras sorbifolium]